MSNIHTFELRQREGSEGLMSGANTEFLIDGVKLPLATSVKIEVGAGELAKITITAFGRFKANGKIDMDLKTLESGGKTFPECSCYAEEDCKSGGCKHE
jgi:hypothetical protein